MEKNLQGYLIAAILALVLLGGGYFYFDYSQRQIERLSTTISTLESANESKDIKIENLTGRIESQKEENRLLEVDLRRSDDNYEELLRVLRSHDLTALAKAKPGLIEKRLNDGTKEVFDNFESITRD